MKYTILTLNILLLSILDLYSEKIYGYIYDQNNNSLPYATIYILANPQQGSVSNNNGSFMIEEENIKENDTLVVSFIGFKTKYLPIKNIKKGETLLINLQEELIALNEAVVFSKTIKGNKKIMREILRQVKAQMELDFPDEKERQYDIISDYAIYNSDSVIITVEKAYGKITEIPNSSKNGNDSIDFQLTKSKTYTNPKVQNSIDNLQNNNAIKDNNKDKFLKTDRKTVPHKMLWGNNIKDFFNYFDDENIKRWKISHGKGNTSILSYRENKNYLGIIKYEILLTFFIDQNTYSVLRLNQNVTVNVNIPFGYKLSEEELEVLNTIALTGENVNKFRIKKGYANVVRNIKYTRNNKIMHPSEKLSKFNIQIQNNKNKEYKWSSSAKIIVTNSTP